MNKRFWIIALVVALGSPVAAQTWDFSSADQIVTAAVPNPLDIGSDKLYVTAASSTDTFAVASGVLNLKTRLASLTSALSFQEPYVVYKMFAPTTEFRAEVQFKFNITSPGQAVALILLDPNNAIGQYFLTTAFWVDEDGPGFAVIGGRAVTLTEEQGAKWGSGGDGAYPGFTSSDMLRLKIEKSGDELSAFASKDDGASWIARGDTTWVDTVQSFGASYFLAMFVAVHPQDFGATAEVPSTDVTVESFEVGTPTDVKSVPNTLAPKKWVDMKKKWMDVK